MPRGDRTGPNGRGPMTGRGMGYCVGNDAPGYINPGYGRGFGRGYGRGFGRGFGRRFIYSEQEFPREQYAEPTKKELLKELKAEKEEIDKAIKDLEKKNK